MAKTFVSIPKTVPALPKAVDHNRHLPLGLAFGWLAGGWRDLWINPVASLAYGLGVTLLSVLTVWAMFQLGWDHILFPALSGFLVVGPLLATGLYEKSHLIDEGKRPGFGAMLFPRRSSALHLLFVGAILLTLMLLWMRAAVLLYALFFGWRPFPGFEQIPQMLLGTPTGLAMLFTGTAVGGLFAAFGFAISAFSIPMMLDKQMDAFSAMASSMSFVWNNLPALLVWAALVLILTLIGFGTGFVGFIIVFPLLGHATWHAYKAIRD